MSNKAFKAAHLEEAVPLPRQGHWIILASTVPVLTVTLTFLVSINFKSKLCGLTELSIKGLLERRLCIDHARALMSLLQLFESSYSSPWMKPTMAAGTGDHGTGWEETAFPFCYPSPLFPGCISHVCLYTLSPRNWLGVLNLDHTSSLKNNS